MKLASRLLVFEYLSSLLGQTGDDLRRLAKEADPGRRPDGQSNYLSMFESWATKLLIDRDQLRTYDANVLNIEDRLGKHRPGFRFTYFQYLALLYTEIYLHRLAGDPEGLLRDLRAYRKKQFQDKLSPVTAEDLRKAAFWMATGSGKTLVAHANLIQFEYYKPFRADNILFIVPSSTLADQHLEELAQSGVPARHALTSGHPDDVQVLEITKLYVDSRESEGPRGGDSLPTSAFEGQNLVLVDEGHKGTATKGDRDVERAWRDIRRSLAGDRGFTFEYSATFAQITEDDDEFLDEYGKTILFDYGYQHFWKDGYGKDYRVVNLKKEGAFDTDELLLAGLLVLYEQHRLYVDTRAEIAPYNIEAPLMAFVGATVTGKAESEVLQVVEFLDRVLTEPEWARGRIEALVAGNADLPSDLFSHRYPYLTELDLSADTAYQDLCRRLFHGTGNLVMHMIRRADGEIGLRTADAAKDAYCGVVNVGNASGFVKNAEVAGITRGEDDHITESVFDRIDHPDSTVSFLIGSKKFIEGWSSWRVSVMGLLKVGKSAGSQIIQLFGRGVRLKGKDMGLRRSQVLPPPHPKHLELLETLHIFGLKADYMEAFNKAVRREGVPPAETRLLPITIRNDVDDLGLLAPDSRGYDFSRDVVVFDPAALRSPIEIDLMPTFTAAEGVADHTTSHGGSLAETRSLPLELVDQERLYLDLLDFKRRRGWYNVYVTRAAVRQFLREKARVIAPEACFDSAGGRSRELAQAAARDALRKGLERFVYAEQRKRETGHLDALPITADHPNFPRVGTAGGAVPAYRLEVPEHLVNGIDKLIANLAAGTADLEDLREPLPRLHLDAHLYTPLLLHETNVDQYGVTLLQHRETLIRSVPTGLRRSEVKFVVDLRDTWATLHEDSVWTDYEIYLLRNLPKRGVGFFQTAGFYPDFLLWLKKGDAQALAFIEPHGMVYGDPHGKVGLLRDIRQLGLSVPTVAYIVTDTSPANIGAIDSMAGGGPVTEQWLRDHHILLQDGAGYIAEILDDLRRQVEAVISGQYQGGGPVQPLRQAGIRILDDSEVSEEERFTTHLPVYDLRAAAGHFGSGEAVEMEGWVPVDGRLSKDMFVARAAGHSMEPTINDGDLCVFRRYRGGTREGRIVLVQWSGPEDPETGGSYAVKRYHRVGQRGEKGFRIELRSSNPAYEPIVLTPDYEDDVAVIAFFVQVLRAPRP
jgi:Uncharacterized protein conserved in bacteria